MLFWQKNEKNNRKCTFFALFLKNIWSIQKKAVPLHSRSDESDVLSKFAAIAQLVEHNLAKVGVASSSLVCRSIEMSRTQFLLYFSKKVFEYGIESAVDCKSLTRAQMAELVDALVSGASVERRAGSSPVLGTTRRW